MLGNRDHVSARRIENDDALTGGEVDVYVVDAHAGATDHLELTRALEDGGGQPRAAADDHRVVLGDDRFQLAGLDLCPHVNLEALALFEYRNAFSRDLVREQHSKNGLALNHHHPRNPPITSVRVSSNASNSSSVWSPMWPIRNVASRSAP